MKQMSTLSWIFLLSLFAPFLIVGAFGKGRPNDNIAEAFVLLFINWAVLFGGMWLAGQISKGILPVIVGLTIQVVFISKAVKKTKFPQ